MNMKTKIYNFEGKEVGTMELPDPIFGVKLNPDLLYQVVTCQLANRRRVLASTKGRGEVSGGGRKPWPQKHTGRARHGSIRSPIWVGGGVAHGPTASRIFKKKINKKMRRKALYMVLSEKARRNTLLVLDSLELKEQKTKIFQEVLGRLPCDRETMLIVLPSMLKRVIRACRNISYAKTIQARDLNVLDLLNAKYLLLEKDSIRVIQETFKR